MAKIVELIYNVSTAGEGRAPNDPVRHIYELWTKDGRLVARTDGFTEDTDGDVGVLSRTE